MADALRRAHDAPAPAPFAAKIRRRPALYADYLPSLPLEAEPVQIQPRRPLLDEVLRTLVALAFFAFAAALWLWA